MPPVLACSAQLSLSGISTKVDLHVLQITNLQKRSGRFLFAQGQTSAQNARKRTGNVGPALGQRDFAQTQNTISRFESLGENYWGDVLESLPDALLRSVPLLLGALLMTVTPGRGTASPVLIADSNRMQAQLLTSALRRRSEFHVSLCGVDETSALRAIASTPAQVVIFSLNPSLSTAGQMATLRRVHLSYPEIAKILLVESADRELALTAFRSGARGIFCIADAHFRLLCRCIQKVAEGQVWANAEQMRYLLDVVSEVPSLRVVNARGNEILTPREQQVVALAAEGLSNREISSELNLSQHTIKKYLFRIFDKLGVSSRVELVLYAVNHGTSLQAEWLAGESRGTTE